MSFREKTAWISILSMLAIYGYYFWSVIHAAPQAAGAQPAGLLEAIVALVVVQAVLTGAAAIVSPRDAKSPPDERDELIELRSARLAYGALATSMAVVCFMGAFNPPLVFNTDALVLILVAAEVLRSACRIIQYRRGA